MRPVDASHEEGSGNTAEVQLAAEGVSKNALGCRNGLLGLVRGQDRCIALGDVYRIHNLVPHFEKGYEKKANTRKA